MADEYISKRAFNDVLHEVVQKYPHTSYNGLDELARQIAHMDAADVAPVQRWVPVTERLPECEWGAEVGNIEWISYGKVFAGCFGRGGKYRDAYFRTWTNHTEGMDAKDADYWRQVQIPEPPKERTISHRWHGCDPDLQYEDYVK